MKELLMLLKKDFYLSFKGPLEKIKAKSEGRYAIQIILIAFLIIYLGGLYLLFLFTSILPGIRLGLGDMIVTAFAGSVGIVAVLFTSGTIISKFYYSSDVKLLLSLPIKINSIFISKILVSILSISGVSLFVFLPICYGIIKYSGIKFFAALGILLVNFANIIITITLVSLAITLFMSIFAGRGGLKNILQAIGFILIITISIAPQFLINNSNITFDKTAEFMNIFLPHLFFLRKIYEMNNIMGLVYGIIIFAISILIFYLLSFPLSKIMVKGVLKNEVISSKKHKGIDRASSAKIAICKKDLLNIIKTPVYFFNIGITGIIFPLILLINTFTSGADFDEIRNLLDNFYALGFSNSDVFVIVSFIFFLYAIFIQPLALTTFTREGRLIYIMQTLPITYTDQIVGRALSSIFFEILNAIPMILILGYFVKFNIIYIIAMIFGTILGSFFSTSFGLNFGIKNAKLDWDNPQEATKRNFPIFVFSLIEIAIVGISFLIIFLLLFKIELDYLFVKIFIIFYFIIMSVIAIYLYKKSIKDLSIKMPNF